MFSFHRVAIAKADNLLNQKHGIVRLDNIWGTGGGIRPVKSLIKRVMNPNIIIFLYLCKF